jgi:hypothetical protein
MAGDLDRIVDREERERRQDGRGPLQLLLGDDGTRERERMADDEIDALDGAGVSS